MCLFSTKIPASSRVKWKLGSSAASLISPMDIFSKSALVLGSIATLQQGHSQQALDVRA